MHNVLPNTIKYRLQTWTPEHWKTHYKGKSSEKISRVIGLLKQLPEKSHLFNRAKVVINAFSFSIPNKKSENAILTDLSIQSSNTTKPVFKRVLNLCEACEKGDLARVRELLASGKKDVNKSNRGLTYLTLAAFLGHVDIVKELIDHGAKINTIPSPLAIACEKGNIQIVELLLEAGANPNLYQERKLEQGSTPLYLACQSGNLEIVKLLLKYEADIDIGDLFGRPPLYMAVIKGKEEIVKYLIHHGANVNAYIRQKTGENLLHLAASDYSPKILETLLFSKKLDVNAKDYRGYTPLHYARDKEIAALLIANGAIVNAQNNNEETLLLGLFENISRAKEDFVIFLIDQGMNFYSQDEKNHLLDVAFDNGLYRAAKKLIEKGADLQKALEIKPPKELLKSEESYSFLEEQKYDLSSIKQDKYLLFLSVTSSNTEVWHPILKNLIKLGVDLNVVNDETGDTPLHLAKLYSTTELLIKGGASPHAVDAYGNTPLHLVFPGIETLRGETLINHMTDLRIENRLGQTVFEKLCHSYRFNPDPDTMRLMLLILKKDLSLLDTIKRDENFFQEFMQKACINNMEPLVFKLLSLGVKVDIPDTDKFTALDRTLVHGHFDLLKKIIEKLGGSYQAYIDHKFLAHVFGLDGFSDFNTFKVDHEGFNYRLSAEKLSLLGGEFLKDRSEHKELFDILQEAPDNLNLSPEELMKKMDEKPVILFTGWDKHIVALVFYKDMIFKCNRGSMSPAEGGVEIFRMKNKEKLPSVLTDLQKYATSEQGRYLLYDKMSKDLDLENEGVFILKNQPVGNCGWSSAKAAFLAVAYLLNLKQGLSDRKARVEGMRLFKEFNTFVRGRVVDYCVTNTENLDKF